MSYCAIKWTYMSPHVLYAGLNPTQLAVLRALCWFYVDKDRTKNNKNCFVSVETLAKTIGKDTYTVDRAKAVLKKKGLIRWDRGAYDEREHASNNYEIFCPELENILKRNEEKRKAALPVKDMDELDNTFPILEPGALYFRPDPKKLATAFNTPLNPYEAEWMADALAFVGDRPEKRQMLYTEMRKAPDLATCREALTKCVKTSKNGRKIFNRPAYLRSALKRQRNSKQGLSRFQLRISGIKLQ